MLTFNRGEWGEDRSYSSEWVIKDDMLEYEGFNCVHDLHIGKRQYIEIHVFSAESMARHQFFVVVGSPISNLCDVLVTDFPSLLMLMKDLAPLAELDREQDKIDIQLEEHQWKAEGLEPHKYKQECQHV